MKRKELTRTLTLTAMIAAMYAVITVALTSPLSFGTIQFRIAEVLVLLCFYNKKFCPALMLGCFVANLASPLGWYDWVFGTLATAIAVFAITKIKNIWLASLVPAIVNGIIVGMELTYLFGEHSFWFNAGCVALGEIAVVTVIGVPLFKFAEKNPKLMTMIKDGQEIRS